MRTYQDDKGYIHLRINGKRVYEHIWVAEKALGKQLPDGAVVHHADENPSNNHPTNLVVCPDQAYHRLIHERMKALEACGNPGWRTCRFCGEYDSPERLAVRKADTKKPFRFHRECERAYHRNRYKQRAA